MKTRSTISSVLSVVALLGTPGVLGQESAAVEAAPEVDAVASTVGAISSDTDISAPAAPVAAPIATVGDVGPHHRRISTVRPLPGPDGRPATGSYIQLAIGMNRFDPDQKAWVPAVAEFEQTKSGYIIARHTQHSVILASDPKAATGPAVDFLTPDGVRLQSTILGIGVLDRVSGAQYLLAELT